MESAQGQGTLVELFNEGLATVPTSRYDSLFKDLDQRALTTEEEEIIAKRVALQRKMLEEFERRERTRKIMGIRELCPDLTEEEADQALKQHGYREEDTVAALTENPALKRRIKSQHGHDHGHWAVVPTTNVGPVRPGQRSANPTANQLKAVNRGAVFVGTFRGKGWERYSNRPRTDENTDELGRTLRSSPRTRRSATQGRQAPSVTTSPPQETVKEVPPNVAHRGSTSQPLSNQRTTASPLVLTNASASHLTEREERAQRRALGPSTESGLKSPKGLAAERSAVVSSVPKSPEGHPLSQPESPVTSTQTQSPPTKKSAAIVDTPSRTRRRLSSSQQQESGASPDGHQAGWRGKGPSTVGEKILAADEKKCPKNTVRGAIFQVLKEAGQKGMTVKQILAKIDPKGLRDWINNRSPISTIAASCSTNEVFVRVGAGHYKLRAFGSLESQAGPSSPLESPPANPSPQGGRQAKGAIPSPRAGRKGEPAVSKLPAVPDLSATDGSPKLGRMVKAAVRSPKAVQKAKTTIPSPKSTPRKRRANNPITPAVMDVADVGVSDSDASTESDDTFKKAAPPRRPKLPPKPPAGRSSAGGRRGRGGPLSISAAKPADGAPSPSSAPPSNANCVGEKRGPSPGSDPDNAAKRPRRMSWRGVAALEAMAVMDDFEKPRALTSPNNGSNRKKNSRGAAQGARTAGDQVLHVPAHKPRLGRVKRCSSKVVELVELGKLRVQPGWHNNGYIFPDGFVVRTVFRSSVELDQLCAHECHIFSRGLFSPGPTFRIVASDRPDEPLDAKSATGAWNAVLERINSEIRRRRELGEDIPPPPKTAIAGPEYFGLTHPAILEEIESLDPERLCTDYWAGKQDRIAYGNFHGIEPDRKCPLPPRSSASASASAGGVGRPSAVAPRRLKGSRRRGDDLGAIEDEEDEVIAGSRWSAVNRAERYKRRHGGEDTNGVDDDNPLPGVIDPITLEPVVTPAMSVYGHVMGLATWRAVLAEQGKCPFTQQPLQITQITVLTKSNIARFQDRIIQP